jgi:hypothetical protein
MTKVGLKPLQRSPNSHITIKFLNKKLQVFLYFRQNWPHEIPFSSRPKEGHIILFLENRFKTGQIRFIWPLKKPHGNPEDSNERERNRRELERNKYSNTCNFKSFV